MPASSMVLFCSSQAMEMKPRDLHAVLCMEHRLPKTVSPWPGLSLPQGCVPDAWVTLGASGCCVPQPLVARTCCSPPSPPKYTHASSCTHSHSCTLPHKHEQGTPASATPGCLSDCPLALLFLSCVPAHMLLPLLGMPFLSLSPGISCPSFETASNPVTDPFEGLGNCLLEGRQT